jgi:hypothetical protein
VQFLTNEGNNNAENALLLLDFAFFIVLSKN